MKKGLTKLEFIFAGLMALVLIMCSPLSKVVALEFQVDKGVAFNFTAPLINSTSNKTFATGGNNTAFYVHSNDNTTFVACGTNTTHIASGIYLFQLNATEMNHSRVGVLYNGTGCLPQYFVINTVPKEALDVVDGIVDDILVDTGTTLDGKIDTIDTNVDSILEDTGTSGVAVASGSKTGYSLAADQSSVTVGTVTSVTNDVGITQTGADKVWGTAARSLTDKSGFSLSASGIDAIWDEVVTGHSTADSFGKVFDDQIDGLRTYGDTNWATATGFSTFDHTVDTVIVGTNNDKTGYSLATAPPTAAEIRAEIDSNSTQLAAIVEDTGTTVPGLIAALNDISAGDVWDVTLSEHLGAGTTGNALNAAGSAGDPWATSLPGAYGAGSAGYILGNNLNAAVSSRSSHSAADVWSVGTRSLTDKAGFTISGTKTTLDALNDVSLSGVWGYATRLLTAGDNIVLAKGTGVTGFNDITAQDVWQHDISAYSGAGYAGTYLKTIYDKRPAGNFLSDTVWTGTKAGYLDALISSRSTLTDSDVWDYATRALTDKAGFTISGTKTTLDSLNDIDAADVWSVGTRTLSAFSFSVDLSAAAIDAVWDELKSGHSVSGSFGDYLDSKVSEAGGGGLTAAAIADAVWDEDLTAHTTTNTTGKKLSESPTPYDIGP